MNTTADLLSGHGLNRNQQQIHGRGRWMFPLLAFVLLFLSLPLAQAQQNSVITGTVTDNQGAAIPGAEVSVTADATGFVSNTVTNANGIYSIPALNVGRYDLKISTKGFQAYVARGLEVNVSQTLRADATLSCLLYTSP